jgi:hypothetical protein
MNIERDRQAIGNLSINLLRIESRRKRLKIQPEARSSDGQSSGTEHHEHTKHKKLNKPIGTMNDYFHQHEVSTHLALSRNLV